MQNIRRTIKSLAKPAETRQSRLHWSYVLRDGTYKQSNKIKSLTSDENRKNENLIKSQIARKPHRKLEKLPKHLTNVLVTKTLFMNLTSIVITWAPQP
ncbi:MAG: hypothetical protein ACTS5A_03045 [Candidatus Hodgkinia cicadicola]